MSGMSSATNRSRLLRAMSGMSAATNASQHGSKALPRANSLVSGASAASSVAPLLHNTLHRGYSGVSTHTAQTGISSAIGAAGVPFFDSEGNKSSSGSDKEQRARMMAGLGQRSAMWRPRADSITQASIERLIQGVARVVDNSSQIARGPKSGGEGNVSNGMGRGDGQMNHQISPISEMEGGPYKSEESNQTGSSAHSSADRSQSKSPRSGNSQDRAATPRSVISQGMDDFLDLFADVPYEGGLHWTEGKRPAIGASKCDA
jgi:hypothetical protein